MRRLLDIFLAVLGLIITSPIIIAVLVVGSFSKGGPLFIQVRVGKGKQPFKLIKFRTMYADTASVASHLAKRSSITPFGHFLRRSKVDELPQLVNVIKGDMSLVGPRPNLFNQEELIAERSSRHVYDVLPGITGLAQVQKVDMSTPKLLAEIDQEMIKNLTVFSYFKYIFMTVSGRGYGDRVS